MFAWMRKLFVTKKPLPEVRSVYHDEIERLKALDIDIEVYLDPTPIETIIANVEEYTQWLSRLNHALHGDIVFPAQTFKLMRVCKCNFYRNMKGEPTNVAYFNQLFVELSIKVLERHDAVLKESHRSAALEATLYRSQALLYNLCNLIKSL